MAKSAARAAKPAGKKSVTSKTRAMAAGAASSESAVHPVTGRGKRK